MLKPFIMVAPTGARRTKSDHAALPMTMDEIVKTAISCHASGAEALHLHVRDDDGRHSLDAGRYLETIAELDRVLPNMPVQITTEAGGIFDVSAQLRCLQAVKPKWASISVREIDRSPELAGAIYGACADADTKVQHILYGPDDVSLYMQRRADGIIQQHQADVICVLGRYSKNQTSRPEDLQPFLTAEHEADSWMVCAFGPFEHACLVDAAQRGGALRVGFENSITDEDGHLHKDNAASVSSLRQRLTGAT